MKPLVTWVVVVTACGSPHGKPAPVSTPKLAVEMPAGPPVRLDAVRPPRSGGAPPAPIIAVLTGELKRSYDALAKHADPPYYASYQVSESRQIHVSASFGTLGPTSESRNRTVDVDVRVGSYKLDNTHDARRGRDNTVSFALPLDDDPYAVRSILWHATDAAYKHASEQLTKAEARTKLTAKPDDDSDDFSQETPSEYFEPPASFTFDTAGWEKRLRALSATFRDHPEVTRGSLGLQVTGETDYFVSTEGTRYQIPAVHARLTISASTTADDGAELRRFEAFDVASPDRLPGDAEIAAKVDTVIADLRALRAAPVIDPYSGPAILEGKAAGVFFHEVFGHRIEGHRQKSEAEGQTFAKMIDKRITASFIDVFDDPSIASLNGVDLNGFYRYDDEGITGQRASLVEAGMLKTFLLGRSPIRGFARSNGHGRRQTGRSAVSRQGNLVVRASHTVDRAALKAMLLDEVKKQGKPFGMLFKELDGGFTMTERFSPQAFKLLPVMVYRVYPDGREELVRGADLEGTPLSALADIRAAGSDVETFNGFCGAESGFVPVSASSPSLLVAHVEVAKKAASKTKPPILPAPPRGGEK